jgi:prepilin-type N-terminal cleavage/methylation domain-containing protein
MGGRLLRKTAFTLVELLVAMLLASILMGVISFVFMQSNRIYSETLDEIDATNVVRSCMEILGDDLRGIQLPAAAGGFTHLAIGSADDGGVNNLDVLRYQTLDRWNTRQPVNVEISIDTATGFLVRKEVPLATVPPLMPNAFPAGSSINLAPNVESFTVEYAWPTWPGGRGADKSSFLQWRRGAALPGGSMSGSSPSTLDGSRFVWRGTGTIDASSELKGVAYDSADHIPLEGATTAYVMQLSGGGGYPVVALTGSFDTVVLAGAPPMTAPFVIPLLPPKLKITIKHRTPLGHQRSLERVLNITR